MRALDLLLTAAASLACASAAIAQPPPPAPSPTPAPPTAPTTILNNITVIDTLTGTAVPAQTVTITGDRIASVQPAAATPPSAPGATVIDAAGLFLIPGLFDSHVHYIDPDTFGPLMLAHGVTFVRDLGGATEQVIDTRDRLSRGELLGPEMAVTGAIIDGKPPVWPFSEECETPEQAREAVRKLKAAGVDQIKVYSRLKPEVYRAAVDEAHAKGLKAVGHIPAACTLDDALAAGQDSVEHLTQFERLVARLVPEPEGPESKRAGIWAGFMAWDRMPRVDRAALAQELKKLASAGMVQCPTLVVMQGIGRLAMDPPPEEPRLELVPTHLRQFWQGGQYGDWGRFAASAVPNMQSMVLELHKAGVPIIAGTDLANPYVFAGSSLHDELALLVGAGLTPAEALRAATVTPARFIGVGDRLGAIAPGMTASLVVLRANPLEDIRNTTRIDSVFLRGHRYDRAALDTLVAGVREAVAATKPADAAAVALELPGEVVHRGRYVMSFTMGSGTFDAGTEEFLITKDQAGYHLIAHVAPKGGPQKPSITRFDAGADFVITAATWKELTNVPTEAQYARDGDALLATAKRGGKDLPPQSLPIPADMNLGGPITAGDFLSLNAAGLKPGESRSFTAVGFGLQGWKLMTTPMTLTREADTTITRPGGAEVSARLYKSEMTSPMGVFRGTTWTDERGVVLKSTVVMPFGTVTAELQ